MTRRKLKKILIILLICTMTFCFAACGKDETNTDKQTTEETVETVDVAESECVKTVELGETITTDIFEITLVDGALAEALDDTEGRLNGALSNGNQLGLPKTWDANEDAGNAWVAPRGCSLVYLYLKIENNDRISYDMPVRELIKGVKYKEKYYDTESFVFRNDGADLNVLLDLAYFGGSGWEKSELVSSSIEYQEVILLFYYC